MNKIFSCLAVVFSVLAASMGYAQTSGEEDCSSAQTKFVSSMEQFRSAFFEREDAEGTAESIMDEQVLPAADQMYQSCPSNVASAVKAGVSKAQASLNDPNREQLVQCDKAYVSYRTSLSRFDSSGISNYHVSREFLSSDISPAAERAIEACPQMPDLARQTRVELAELQNRLNKMEDLENAGPTMADNIDTSNADYLESMEDD